LWDSVTQNIFMLPAETLLFSAHAQAGLVSSVLDQRRRHPWFAGASRDDFLARVRTSGETMSRMPKLFPSQ
jgi:sulfur dioxygenase